MSTSMQNKIPDTIVRNVKIMWKLQMGWEPFHVAFYAMQIKKNKKCSASGA